MIKAVQDEGHSPTFRLWLAWAHEGRHDLLAPHLLRYELGHVLARLTGWTAERRATALEYLVRGVRWADGTGVEDFAPPLTYYDGSYLALARAVGATLVTYDASLLKAAARAKVPAISP